MIRIRRAYDEPKSHDGHRVRVERLWPRGVRKDALHLDDWLKDVAPSDALRRWFGHDPAKWKTFARRYRAELLRAPASTALAARAQRGRRGTVTMIYSAKDEKRNSAIVLCDAVQAQLVDRRDDMP